jgi:hypothetical protein
MLLTNSVRCAVLALAALIVTSFPASARAVEHKGTVIHITNNTDKAMTFFVEIKTSEGKLRHFVSGAYLKAGESTTFTVEPDYLVSSRRENGGTKYSIRVRAFRGRLESLLFSSVAGETPDYWWGGNGLGITGLKCEDWDRDGYTHLSASLIW